MRTELERLKFGGMVHRAAENIAASLSEDTDNALVERLYAAYVEAGTPRNVRQWIAAQVQTLFLSAGEGPVWVGGTPTWPFLDGRPMVFIRQFPVGTGPTESSALSPGSVLYVFGLRVGTPDRWEMKYRVVQDHDSTKGLRMVPTWPLEGT